MKWLTSDFSDFYIEEEQIYNPCGEFIRSDFYIKYADYNIFGKKKYIRFTELIDAGYGYDFTFYVQETRFSNKEAAITFWKSRKASTKSITHKINCNE